MTDTHPPALVERVAEAMANAGASNPEHWQRINERTRHTYRRMARAALDAATLSGVKIGGTPKPRVYTDADAEAWADHD